MNTQEYISSGILELYAAGALPPQEMREVEQMAAQFPEVQRALDESAQALAGYAGAHRMNPPPELRSRLMRSLDAETGISAPAQSLPVLSGSVTTDSERPPQTAPAVKPLRLYSGMRYLTAASVIIAVMSGALAYYFYDKWTFSDQQLQAVVVRERQMADKLQHTKQDLNVMHGLENTMVILKGMNDLPDGRAHVYWNRQSGQVYLDVMKVSALDHDKQYQLWALVDGKPVDAGVFDSAPDGMLQMKTVPAGTQMFAVTIEPRGGSNSPTMQTLCLMGKVLV